MVEGLSYLAPCGLMSGVTVGGEFSAENQAGGWHRPTKRSGSKGRDHESNQ